ncbi:MAG: peptide deformylase [Bacteroidota bacterium]|nr:peptide deformylase [Bacteroidota bacterium]
MILPILAYGSPVLKQKAKWIDQNYSELNSLLINMWETMYSANGVGLAAPQIGKSIRLFIVDTKPFSDDGKLTKNEVQELQSFKKVFINPEIVQESGVFWDFNEGCLSIPEIREDISRKEVIKIKFLDENFESQTLVLKGLIARVVQHEYDHIEGILFTDRISSFKKKLIRGKLDNVMKGKIETDYKMLFPNKKITNKF